MPIGLLIPVLLAAIVTAAALAPAPRSWALGQLVWRLGLQANELPLVVVAWILLATALTASQGDLTTPVGIAAAILAALTVTGLVVVLWRGLRASLAAEQALSLGLGPRWRDAVPPATAIRMNERRPWLRLVFAPLAVRHRDVIHQADLAYGPHGRQNLLDIYRPRTAAAAGRCLVYFHGGGYRSGRKNREARALIYRLASLGWVCVSANYRLARTAPYPAPLVDAKRTIAWMREHATAYGADPSTIVVAGSSAGAHLAAMTALTQNVPRLQPGFESADTRVSAAICLYGFYGSPSWIDREPGSPSAAIEQLSTDAPSMLVAHGTHDSFVSVNQARDFVDRFRATAPNRLMVYLELLGAQHTFDLYNSFRFHAVIHAAEAFLDRATAPANRHPQVHSDDAQK